MESEFEINPIFPVPVYQAHRNSDLDLLEEKDIEDIIEEGFVGSFSLDFYIFNNNRLQKIKQFCEKHIETYVKQIINPKQELDFYITQSWLSYTKPGESQKEHSHSNSIISGVFYISTKENDGIVFTDPNYKIKDLTQFEQKEMNIWNYTQWYFPVNNNDLILFPSWLEHSVPLNESNTDRISLAFNIFAKGIFGSGYSLNRLIL